MIANERRIAGWLLAVIVFLIVFGSLYPFSFSLAGAGPLERLGELPNAGTTRSDVAANVLLYLPLGTCLAWLLAARHGSTLAVLGATLIAAGLSFAIEFAQLYETRRVASLADFACNTAGAFLGGGLALAIARTRRRLHVSHFAGFLRHPVAAAVFFSWIGYRLSPFALVFDPAEWAASVAPFAAGGWPAPGDVLVHLVAWLTILFLGERLSPGRATVLAAARDGRGARGTHPVLRPRARGGRGRRHGRGARPRAAARRPRAPAGGRAARRRAPRAHRLARARALRLPARAGPLRAAAVRRVAHAIPRREPRRHVPALLHERRTGLAAVPGGPVALAATAIGAGAVFAIELLQTWLPGQTAEITDPLLAVCAGGLIAVFEREGNP